MSEVDLKFVAEGDIQDRSVNGLITFVDREMEKLVRKVEKRYQNVTCPNYAKVEAQ